jgi:hypothetical protein
MPTNSRRWKRWRSDGVFGRAVTRLDSASMRRLNGRASRVHRVSSNAEANALPAARKPRRHRSPRIARNDTDPQ